MMSDLSNVPVRQRPTAATHIVVDCIIFHILFFSEPEEGNAGEAKDDTEDGEVVESAPTPTPPEACNSAQTSNLVIFGLPNLMVV